MRTVNTQFAETVGPVKIQIHGQDGDMTDFHGLTHRRRKSGEPDVANFERGQTDQLVKFEINLRFIIFLDFSFTMRLMLDG